MVYLELGLLVLVHVLSRSWSKLLLEKFRAPVLSMVGGTTSSKDTRKRKQAPQEEATHERDGLNGTSNLEMFSDDEDGEEISSDDGEVEEFPEIDVASDSEEYEESGESGEEDDERSEGDSDDSDLHIFPKPKTIVSDITGRPKRVYPEIEPDYDSDSSTEDVSFGFLAQIISL